MKPHLLPIITLWLAAVLSAFCAQPTREQIRLLVREDDMGSFHAANVACIECYRDGIARSVEVMVNGPWFPEAARLLKENPGLDVGVHLVLTSEWDNFKWAPKACVPSLVDSNGFFFPMVWRNDRLPPFNSIQESRWTLNDVEKELRAQIETALRNVRQVTHLSGHMGFEGLDARIRDLVERLRREYRLQPGQYRTPIKPFPGWRPERAPEARIRAFISNLEKLTPGTYLFVEHPVRATPEMESVGHPGYEDVAADREAVRRVFTSSEVRKAIQKLSIRLISYADLQ